MKGFKELLLGVMLSFPIVSYAQITEKPVHLLNLLQQVHLHAPQLKTDSAAILIRRAEANEVKSAWLPDLKLSYQADLGTNNNVAGPYFGFGMVPSDSRGVRTNSNSNTALANLGIASLDWEVYNFGAYHAQNQLAASRVRVDEAYFQQSKYQLDGFAISHYLQLLRLYEFLSIQKQNIARNQQIIHTIVVLARSGLRAGIDTSIAGAELSKAKLVYIELDNVYKNEQQNLALITGLPSQNIQPDTTLENQLMGKSFYFTSLGADSSNHPLIAYYRSRYQQSQAVEQLTRKSYNPKISIEAAAWGRGSSIDAHDQFNSFNTGWGFNRSNYLVGLALSYNLTDLKRRQLKLKTRKLASSYALKQLDEQKASLSASSNEASTELTTSMSRLDEIPVQLKAAQDAYRQKFSLYKNGLTDIIELDASLNVLYRAETDYSRAKNQFAFALFQKAITENQLAKLLNLLN